MNSVQVIGKITKNGIALTKSVGGVEMASFNINVKRSKSSEGGFDTIPVIAYREIAKFIFDCYKVGDNIQLYGELRRLSCGLVIVVKEIVCLTATARDMLFYQKSVGNIYRRNDISNPSEYLSGFKDLENLV